MATIREELVLYDKFTNTFTSYIRQGEQAASVTKTAQDATEKFTKSQKEAADSTSKLTGTVKNLVGAYVGLQGLKSLFTLSDTLTQTTARLDMMNDGLQTTNELNNMIYQSAMRARASYQSTADFVSKLGTLAGNAFDSNAELVAFAEQINKQITLSGTSSQAADAAMLQLTQGLSSGVLRGEELNSVLEQTPMIAQTIADYLGMTTGEMREFASEGKLTADIVKNAILGATDETNAKFESIPLTWSQVWTMAQNIAIKALNPVLTAISWLANNIEIIGPIVLGLAGAFAVFQVAAHWTRIASVAAGVYRGVVNLLSIGFGVLSGSSAAASAAVFTFNSALLASPITWVVMGVMLLVAAIYAAVAVFNKFTNSSVSATGIIAGAVATLAAFIYNTAVGVLNAVIQLVWTIFGEPFMGIIEFVLNAANGGFNSFGDAVANLIGNIISWFLSLGKVVTTIIDAIFGTDWTAGLSSLQSKVQSWGKNENAITLDRNVNLIDRVAYSDAFSSGYNFGSNLAGKFSNIFSSGSSAFSGIGTAGASFDDLAGDVSSISGDVGGIEKSVNMADEDLQSLVDMAERRYVNNINLTAQTPVINITGQNTGNTAADRRALANAIKDILVEQVAAGSVRTTARAF